MTVSGSPACLVVGLGFVCAAVLSGVSGCASVHSPASIVDDAGAGSGGSTSAGAGGSVGSGGNTGAGGSTSSGAGGFSISDAGVSDAPTDAGAGGSGCVLTISPVAPPSFTGVEAGPGARMRVQASARGAVTTPITWEWTVTFESSTAPITTTAIDSVGADVTFPIEVVGRYQIVAQLAGQPTCHRSQVIQTVAPGPMVYALRATATGFPVQEERITLAPTDPQQADFRLKAGVDVNLSPQRADMNGGSLASYVRITDPVSTFSIDGDSTKGPVTASLVATLTYDVLIVPTEPYAPDLLQATPGSWPQQLQLDQGVKVTATALDGGGKAVGGARLVLHRGSLPSTVGVSDSDGVAVLWARAGTLVAYIEPPIDSGLPSATVGATSDPINDPGVLLDPGVASLDLSMTWDPVTSAELSIQVRTPGGAPAGAGARVRATSQASPGTVGTFIAHPAGSSAVMLHATGSTDVEVATDATGTAVFAALPVGAYVVTIVPASTAGTPSANTQAITTTRVTLPTGGFTSAVTLSTKSTLTGVLLPISDSPGTQVTAIDRDVTAPGPVVSAIVAADGTYQLFVDPGRSYELLAQPPAGVQRGRAIVASSVSDAVPAIPSATLPIVHPAHGTVTGADDGVAIGGVLMQAFCVSTSTKCLDATFPLAEALTRSDGSFDLLLPDPPGN